MKIFRQYDAVTVEEYRVSTLVRFRLSMFRALFTEEEKLVWVSVGVVYCPYRHDGTWEGMKRECRRYAADYLPVTPLFLGLRHRKKITSSQAMKLTGVAHRMAAVDKLRDLLTELQEAES